MSALRPGEEARRTLSLEQTRAVVAGTPLETMNAFTDKADLVVVVLAFAWMAWSVYATWGHPTVWTWVAIADAPTTVAFLVAQPHVRIQRRILQRSLRRAAACGAADDPDSTTKAVDDEGRSR